MTQKDYGIEYLYSKYEDKPNRKKHKSKGKNISAKIKGFTCVSVNFKILMFYVLILLRLRSFLCIQFVIMSIREFKSLSLSMNFKISSLSSSQRWQFPYKLVHALDCLIISHLIFGSFDSSINFQYWFDKAVLPLFLISLNEESWFLILALKEVLASPT